MDRRLVFGAAGLVLLAGLVGVLAFSGEEAETQPLVYNVSWPVEPGPAVLRTDELQENRSERYAFELNRPNVTRVTVRLNWTDDVGDADRFRVRVVPPEGQPVVNESANGSLAVRLPLATPPAVNAVSAENRSHVRSQLLDEARETGRGTWQVNVTLLEAPGRRPVAQAPQLETEPDGSSEYNLTFAHRAFHAEIASPQPPPSGG